MIMIHKTLYSYWRSSASYRVRIALNLKEIPYEQQAINLLEQGQYSNDYLTLNPQGLVPFYVEQSDKTTLHLSQSLAIMDYLDEAYPEKPLLPIDIQQRARIRSIAQIIACDVHPLNNSGVLNYLDHHLSATETNKHAWYQHWIAKGFVAIEKQLPDLLAGHTFSLIDKPGYLEAVIIPQIYNARRFNCPLDHYPCLLALDAACMELDAFKKAVPEQQPDAPSSL